MLALCLTAILARVARSTIATGSSTAPKEASAAPEPTAFEVRLARAPAVLNVTPEVEGRLDPGPLVGSLSRNGVTEALAGLPVAGATGMVMNRGDDLTGALFVPLGFAGGDTKTGLVLDPTGSGAGTPGKATFMGVEAMGRRFLIIADRSSSMAGPKFEKLRGEIVQTLQGLKPGAKFYLIFYSDRALPCPETRWLSERRDGAKFLQWLGSLGPAGGTEPLSAFQLAFTELRPRPDAIFFMTDGLFPLQVANEILKLNTGRKPIPIHTISLVDHSAEACLRKIAEDSKGTYRHVDLTSP